MIFRLFIFSLISLLFIFTPNFVIAEPTFLNRQAFPLTLSLNEIGPFHQNFLKTYEVFTQWNNPSNHKIIVEMGFTFYDMDSGKNLGDEDGNDDPLLNIVEIFTIPPQVGYWAKNFLLTVIGSRLNQGFDHPNEGSTLELYVDAQIVRIRNIEP